MAQTDPLTATLVAAKVAEIAAQEGERSRSLTEIRKALLHHVETDIEAVERWLDSYRRGALYHKQRIEAYIYQRWGPFPNEENGRRAMADSEFIPANRAWIEARALSEAATHGGNIARGQGRRAECRAKIECIVETYERFTPSYGAQITLGWSEEMRADGALLLAGWAASKRSGEQTVTSSKVWRAVRGDGAPTNALHNRIPGATVEAWHATANPRDLQTLLANIRCALEESEPTYPAVSVGDIDTLDATLGIPPEAPEPEEFAARVQAQSEHSIASLAELRLMAGLSRAQDRILDMHLAELTNKEIARKLGPTVTEDSVKQQCSRIYKKLKAAAGISA
jgi:DNA-binding CsgD family transcriptional regulator